jgi:hypothetical protein
MNRESLTGEREEGASPPEDVSWTYSTIYISAYHCQTTRKMIYGNIS